MNSRPPESDIEWLDERPRDSVQQRTDFESLNAAPVTARARKAEPIKTDFESLQKSLAEDKPTHQRMTVTDWFVEALSPAMVLVMVLSVTLFILDVRLVFTEVSHHYLTVAAICFVVGIVALNRLVARDSSEESLLYIGGLSVAVFLYTLAYTTYAGYQSAAWIAVTVNVVAVGLVWWVVNRLVHECCVDENYSAGDVGILTGTLQRFRKAIRSEKSAEQVAWERARSSDVIVTNELEAFDPAEQKSVKTEQGPRRPVASARLSKRHAGISIVYFSVPVMFLFAAGQRALLAAGPRFDLRGMIYIMIYTASALTLLMLTSLGGLRAYFLGRNLRVPHLLGAFWFGAGSLMLAAVLIGALLLPLPPNPPAAAIEHQRDEYTRGDILVLQPTDVTAAEQLQQTRFIQGVRTTVLIALALFVLYGLLRGLQALATQVGRNRYHFPPWFARLCDRIEAFLGALLRIPTPRKRPRRVRVDRGIATCARYTNPMGRTDAGQMAISEHIELTYDALCALAYDLGVPRQPGQTPYEFIRSFPEPLRPLREEAEELTNLYVAAAYSEAQLDPRVLDRLRRFWLNYERFRRTMLR